jgi:hypothetical protein
MESSAILVVSMPGCLEPFGRICLYKLREKVTVTK